MAASSWGKQPPKKSEYTSPALSTPSFWGPAPVPPKVYTVWEEIWGADGADGTAFEGQESLELGEHESYVAPPIANDLEAASPGFEDETITEGSFRAMFDGLDPNTEGSFRAMFDGLKPNTEGSFRAMFHGLDPNTEGSFGRLMGGEDPNTEGNFRATAGEGKEAAEASEDEDSSVDQFGEWLHQDDKITKPIPFIVDPYERSGNFRATFEEKEVGKYDVIPFSGLDTPSGVFDPNPINTPSGQAKPDPFVGQWNFRVKIDGVSVENSKFVSVSGITSETEAISYKFSGDSYMQSMPGVYKFSDVELTRVHKTGSDDFYKWREMIERGVDDQRTVTIHLHNVSLKDAPVMTMVLHNAWPIKWEFPELNAGSSDAALEKITLNVGRITKG